MLVTKTPLPVNYFRVYNKEELFVSLRISCGVEAQVERVEQGARTLAILHILLGADTLFLASEMHGGHYFGVSMHGHVMHTGRGT